MNKDIYPSRGGEKAKIVPRQDPVVYNKKPDNSVIDEDLVKKYEDQGFLILENIFGEEEIQSLQQELEQLRNSEQIKDSEYVITEPGNNNVRSVFKVHEISPVFKKLAEDERLAGLAACLLDDSVYVHQSRVNYKPGFKGKEFYWHSDFETWHVEDGMPRMRALSMSIILTDNYTYNGALMLIPGSHKVYVVCEGETPADHFKSSLKKQENGIPGDNDLRQLVEDGGIVTATGKPGSVVVFDCNTMHGSNGNITPYPRSNAFFVYNAMSNRVIDPFCDQSPRPDHICSRQKIEAIWPSPEN